MEEIKTQEPIGAEKALHDFCSCWFEQRDAIKALALLTDDIHFVGTGLEESADGAAAMAAYIRQDIQEIPEPFAITIAGVHTQPISDKIRNLSADLFLKNTQYAWHVRGFFTMCLEQGAWRIRTLHFAEPGRSQRGGEHYPQTLVIENIARQRVDLLSASIAGGMMGGYIEEGFPFYFINRQMLEYLGYETEKEFVADIDGLVINCMHPDDRAMVDASVERQLAAGNEYTVEYRMKRKDGSYIWVHDTGRKVTDISGRPVISSVCVDITDQKQAQEEVMHLYNNIPGAVFRCRFDAYFSVIDANDGLFEFLGYTKMCIRDSLIRIDKLIYDYF